MNPRVIEVITKKSHREEGKEMRGKIFNLLKANKISQAWLKNENNSHLCGKGLRGSQAKSFLI